ncbi:MAG: hypothetical protein IT442_05010 [Phycisphaeraceae bacterium]|nr:hypothetical protein [Phycisphaeraceae bacterium]
MSDTRTITLTGRPPVTIVEGAWPIIADAKDHEYDGQVESQANRESWWECRVRQHADGRTIVYGHYRYTTHYQGERGYLHRAGVLLPGTPHASDICLAIERVCADLAACEHCGDDAARWDEIRAQCISDMPAEELT